MEVRIADPEGRTVPLGTQGELCFGGYMVMRGYWSDEAQTRETIDAAHWLHSGDLGVMDADGYITITGRSKDMVIRGGENIYPREVEEFLYTHPDILDAQVIGVPDARYGEELMAWIRLRPGAQPLTAEGLREFCQGRLQPYKIPVLLQIDDEAIILCPANHSPPTNVRPYPGFPGFEAVATCLASPEVRARTEGVIAWRPQVA